MATLKVYTRPPIDRRTYPTALAASVHFAVSNNGTDFDALNVGCGILFPRAEISEENSILERNIQNPKIARANGKIFIFGNFIAPTGENLAPESVYVYATADFLSYDDIGLTKKDALCFDADAASDTLEITEDEYANLKLRFDPLRFSGVRLPDGLEISDISELDSVLAEVIYSDGSVDKKKIRWDTSELSKSGKYTVKGEILQKKYGFPLVCGFADPVIFEYGGKFYFIATNDLTGAVGLYVREAESPEALLKPDCEPTCILDYDEERGFIQTFWAPEFHIIGGELCILFAVGGKKWDPQSHIMKLRRGGSISSPDGWEAPVRICKMNGEYISTKDITLDMTFFRFGGKAYYCWSQRHLSPDSGSMLYVAEVDEADPTRLASEPVLISRPLYGWENQSGTVNNEGPYPLYAENGLYLNYSAAAAGAFSYSSGFLYIQNGSDPLLPSSWKKDVCPSSSSFLFGDREGPAHGSFFHNREDGKTYYVCHAQKHGEDGKRNASVTRVHFGALGRPVLALSADEDLPESAKNITLEVTLR